jgi:DNA-binding MarR family transcriptional regulator
LNRSEIFKELEKIKDRAKDFTKILSNLHYTHFYLMDKYNKFLSVYDLTAPQSNVLGIIGHFSPKALSLEEIKNMVLEPNSDVSRIVARLVEKGYAVKVINKANRRKVSILLTAKGKKVYERMVKDQHFQKFTAAVTLQEAKTFTRILRKLRTS